MADNKGLFEVKITIKHPDAEHESEVVKTVASEFLRMGVKRLVVIANDEQVHYVDNEVYNVTTGDLFRIDPLAPTDSFLTVNPSSLLN